MRKFTADFETNVSENDCRVWAYALCEIGNTDNFIYGNDIEDFIKFCSNKKENYVLYFHNLKFDGEYIFSYLLENGYTCIKDKKDRADKTFTTLISDTGQFYSIEIFFETKNPKHINKLSRDEFERFTKLIEKTGKSQQYMNIIFKEIYFEMLTDLAYYFDYDKDKLKMLHDKLMKLKPNKFLRLFEEDKAIHAIIDYYPVVTKGFNAINPDDIKDDVVTLYDNLIDNIDIIIQDYA